METRYRLVVNGGKRPALPIDRVQGDGTALDTVRYRPTYKQKAFKKITKKLAEAEEYVQFVRKKKNLE